MQQSDDANTPKTLSREQRWEIVRTLLQRSNLRDEAKQAFRQAYPNAPEEMLEAAAFHTYGDGIGAAIDWLVDLELFLREPGRKLAIGATYHVLYHLYNWYQFSELLPDGKAGVLQRLQEIRELVADRDVEAILTTVEELEAMFKGGRNPPNFSTE
ncbi:hypothetical protein H6F43_20830 [Leptolyngbya sp. FACHB-36]|uniref:hypothetical protein n=1 Tax=Leptolyngbya sp. FACHB-36 TaxID=2692808 RepID=UPI0016803634|nr:hypothetical protein [Leptolyngbya sp. FACHB-36]MBD2022632.1 hypothetical protein [Leptolyngbya sp. FACHB-36]